MTLQGLIAIIRDDYENGLSFNRTKGNLSTTNMPKMNPESRTKDLSGAYALLTEQYAKGVLNKEQFLQVIESLMQHEETKISPSYL